MHPSRFFLLCSIVLPLAAAQTTPPRLIHATGDATVQAKPDHAQMRLSVVTESSTAQAAAAANARQTEAVMKSLRSAVTPGSGELKTAGYLLEPQYEYPQNSKPKLTGYRATNSVVVDTDQLETAGKILDAAVQSGANEVGNLVFSLRDEQAARQAAIAKAATVARGNAEAAAKALGLQVVSVADVVVNDVNSPQPIRPLMQRAMADTSSAAPTPVEAGSLTIRASVSLALQVQ